MTSQQWLTCILKFKKLNYLTNSLLIIANDSSSSIWFHYINIAVPDVIKSKDTAFVYISNGDIEFEYFNFFYYSTKN
jgi:PhoPQ-activated pathogenicity-related protein